jgi:hypothetical protein
LNWAAELRGGYWAQMLIASQIALHSIAGNNKKTSYASRTAETSAGVRKMHEKSI